MTRKKQTLIAAVFLVFATVHSPASAEWREAKTDHFVVVSEGSERELLRMSRQLESVHWLMGLATRANTTDNVAPVRIILVDSIRDVRRAHGGDNRNVAGFYRTFVEGAVAVVPRDQGDFSRTILFHEYAHHFMSQYMRGNFPPWYTEGFAEVISTASFEREGRISFGRAATHRAYELLQMEWTPMQRMMSAPRADRPRDGQASYGQYWLAVHYFIFSGQRRGELSNYINRINQGESIDEAHDAFTGGLELLDRDMRAYLRRNSFTYQNADIPADVGGTPVVRSLTPGEGAIVAAEVKLSGRLDTDEALALATEVGGIAARYPSDPAPWRLQARLLLDAERWADAETAADHALAAAPDDIRSLTYKGLAILRGGEANGSFDDATIRRARVLIVRANRASPDDPMPLIAYYQSFKLAGQAVPDLAIEGLYRASRLVPQESELRMMVAMEMIQRREYQTARLLLAPLGLSPHRSSGQAYALQLIRWIDTGAQGRVPIYVPPIDISVEGDPPG
jgi:tetratricopeptide (TPR) repeat protein